MSTVMDIPRFPVPFLRRLREYVDTEVLLALCSCSQRDAPMRAYLLRELFTAPVRQHAFAERLGMRHVHALVPGIWYLDAIAALPATHLIFTDKFNASLQGVTFPSTVTHIEFGTDFTQPLVGVQFPPKLKYLSFAAALKSKHWARSASVMFDFRCAFQRTLKRVAFPPSLRCIVFIGSYAPSLKKAKLPSNIVIIDTTVLVDRFFSDAYTVGELKRDLNWIASALSRGRCTETLCNMIYHPVLEKIVSARVRGSETLIEKLEACIERPEFDVEQTDNVGTTELGRVLSGSPSPLCVDVAKLLLKHGADPNGGVGRYVNSPIPNVMPALALTMVADNSPLMQQSKKTAQMLLSFKADVNRRYERQEQSILMTAASKGFTEFVKFLLDHNADVNQQDCRGNSAMHLIRAETRLRIYSLADKEAMLALLKKLGGDDTLKNHQGFTAQDLALVI